MFGGQEVRRTPSSQVCFFLFFFLCLCVTFSQCGGSHSDRSLCWPLLWLQSTRMRLANVIHSHSHMGTRTDIWRCPASHTFTRAKCVRVSNCATCDLFCLSKVWWFQMKPIYCLGAIRHKESHIQPYGHTHTETEERHTADVHVQPWRDANKHTVVILPLFSPLLITQTRSFRDQTFTYFQSVSLHFYQKWSHNIPFQPPLKALGCEFCCDEWVNHDLKRFFFFYTL